MRIGFGLPNVGPLGTPEAVGRIAQRAEELNYDGLWVIERLLYPVQPQTPYPATPDGSLPDVYKHVLDPLETLTFAAARTKRIGLGTSVLDIPYYNPVMLARRVSTLDVLSGGRVRLGLGLGWSRDEYQAVGASFKSRGALADEFLAVLKAIWTTDPVEYRGRFFHVPRSIIQPKPAQKPHPPIYLAAFAEGALGRVAKATNGWNPVAMPAEVMARTFAGIRKQAQAEGRDPDRLEMIVRANLELDQKPRSKDGMIFTGTLDQIKADVEACRKIGAHEIIFDPTFQPGAQTLERWLGLMEQMRPLV